MKSRIIRYLIFFTAISCIALKCEKEESVNDEDISFHPTFTVTPETGPVTTTFSFDASESFYRDGSNPENYECAEFQWDFDYKGYYDTDWDTEVLEESSTSHQYTIHQTYTVLLKVSGAHTGDGHGLFQKDIIVTPETNEPPVAVITIEPEEGFQNITSFYADGSLSWDEEDGLELHEFMWDKDGDGNYDGDFADEPFFTRTYTEPGIYIIKLKVRDSGGLTGETEDLLVVTSMEEPCPGIPAVSDIDDNIYNTVLIGDQCWMKENLKTSKYSDGTPIPNVTDGAGWANLTTGAYVWYENEISWKEDYGALYNWFAVNDPHGLCPVDWHVPTDEEWTVLTYYIGGTVTPNGNKLKSCRQVNSQLGGDCNTSEHPRWIESSWSYGTDDYGFSALPGGLREPMFGQPFGGIGSAGYWWTSTEYTTYSAYYRSLSSGGGFNNTDTRGGKWGQSVRCIKNN